MPPIQANDYFIYFNENAYEALNILLLNKNYSKLFILVDNNTNEHCLPLLLPNIVTEVAIEIIEFEAGERFKNIETCIQIWEALTELGADRKSLMINLGGGVITDLGGFVASTFKRGIDIVNIPTTLLSMVDASVGGKNGIDLGNLKNQIGVFNVPNMILIDTQYLDTLPKNEMRSGLAEMLKHGLIFDKEYWEKFSDLSVLSSDDLDSLIYDSIVIKNKIVMKDPKEKGIRKSLNFGHTLGHAIESYFLENQNKTTLLHGEAIAVGMILESFVSMKKEYITLEEYKEIKNTIKKIFDDIIFLQEDIKPIINLLIHDKKNEYGKIKFVLINKIGNVIIDQFVENELVNQAFVDYKL